VAEPAAEDLVDAMRLVLLVSVAVVVVLLTGKRLDARGSRAGVRLGDGLPAHGRTVRGG
jgi:hypothetical protein